MISAGRFTRVRPRLEEDHDRRQRRDWADQRPIGLDRDRTHLVRLGRQHRHGPDPSQQPNGSGLPLVAWLVGSRRWTPVAGIPEAYQKHIRAENIVIRAL